MKSTSAAVCAFSLLVATAIGAAASAQGVTYLGPKPRPAARYPVQAPSTTTTVQASVAEPATPAIVTPRDEHIPEGTEVRIRFNDHLSSATASAGDTFSITTDEAIDLPDGAVIPAGYRGKGEVTDAEKKGMLGKPGQLNVRLDYVKIGNVRVRLRASKGEQGKDGVTSTIVLTVLFGPLGLIKHGHDIDIPKGQTLMAYVDDDTVVQAPIAPPPPSDD